MLFEFRRQSQDANKTRREPWAWFSSRWTRLRRSRHSRAENLEDRTLLAVFDVTTTADVISAVDGVLSLREAMIAAETNVGSDTINLPAGTYSLTLSGVENSTSGFIGTIGDLDLTNTNGGRSSRLSEPVRHRRSSTRMTFRVTSMFHRRRAAR